jgi:hypothetical protein
MVMSSERTEGRVQEQAREAGTAKRIGGVFRLDPIGPQSRFADSLEVLVSDSNSRPLPSGGCQVPEWDSRNSSLWVNSWAGILALQQIFWARRVLFQLRVLRLRLLQDGDVGVGVLPKGEEILVGGMGFDRVISYGVGPGEAEL